MGAARSAKPWGPGAAPGTPGDPASPGGGPARRRVHPVDDGPIRAMPVMMRVVSFLVLGAGAIATALL